ncbi:MAG: tyrosine-type recombinase/integrase [Polyangiales bacterium]
MTDKRRVQRPTSGNVYERRGVLFVRVSVGGGKRPSKRLHGSLSRDAADDRARAIDGLVAALRSAGQSSWIARTIDEAAAAPDDATLAKIRTTVMGICDGSLRARSTSILAGETFETFAKRWTSGELHQTYPDQVRLPAAETRTNNAANIARYINPIVGHVPIAAFTREHAREVMRQIDERARDKRRTRTGAVSKSTRRHVAQNIRRVLELAVEPCALIASNPIPKGFVPKVPKHGGKARAFLFPDEDAKLLARTETPIERRVLFGFLTREGMRREEAATLEWSDVDLVHGIVSLDVNKTHDPRSWALDRGVVAALLVWRKMRRRARFVFGGKEEPNVDHLADRLREDLAAAGVNRPQLFESSTTRRKVNVHDLRGTFVSLALAAGRSEDWISERTGHRSSSMIRLYKREGSMFAQVGEARLRPLVEAIPELAARGGNVAAPSPNGAHRPRSRSASPVDSWPMVVVQANRTLEVEGSIPLSSTARKDHRRRALKTRVGVGGFGSAARGDRARGDDADGRGRRRTGKVVARCALASPPGSAPSRCCSRRCRSR